MTKSQSSVVITPAYFTAEFPTRSCIFLGDATFGRKRKEQGYCIANVYVPKLSSTSLVFRNLRIVDNFPANFNYDSEYEFQRGVKLDDKLVDELVSQEVKKGAKTIFHVAGGPLVRATHDEMDNYLTSIFDNAALFYSRLYSSFTYARYKDPMVSWHVRQLAKTEREISAAVIEDCSLLGGLNQRRDDEFSALLKRVFSQDAQTIPVDKVGIISFSVKKR
jgi:hypothetical protein